MDATDDQGSFVNASVAGAVCAATLITVAGYVLRNNTAPPVVRVPVVAASDRAASERRPVFGRVGRVILGGIGRIGRSRPTAAAAVEEAIGGVVVAAVPLAVLDLRLGLMATVVAFAVPWLRRRRQQFDDHQQVLRELPEIVDLLSVAVGGGLTIPMAITAVGERLDGVVSRALAQSVVSAKHGRRLADVLELVPDELGDTARPLFRALVSAERYGTPIADALARIAADLRIERRRFAETTARRLPVKLLFPLVVCILPAFVLLTVVPVLVSSLASLRN